MGRASAKITFFSCCATVTHVATDIIGAGFERRRLCLPTLLDARLLQDVVASGGRAAAIRFDDPLICTVLAW